MFLFEIAKSAKSLLRGKEKSTGAIPQSFTLENGSVIIPYDNREQHVYARILSVSFVDGKILECAGITGRSFDALTLHDGLGNQITRIFSGEGNQIPPIVSGSNTSPQEIYSYYRSALTWFQEDQKSREADEARRILQRNVGLMVGLVRENS